MQTYDIVLVKKPDEQLISSGQKLLQKQIAEYNAKVQRLETQKSKLTQSKPIEKYPQSRKRSRKQQQSRGEQNKKEQTEMQVNKTENRKQRR